MLGTTIGEFGAPSSKPSGGGGGGGALSLIQSTVLVAPEPTVTFAAIPGTFNHLKLVVVARSAAAQETDSLSVALNTDGGAHYDGILTRTTVASVAVKEYATAGSWSCLNASFQEMPAASATANMPGIAEFFIPDYTGTTFQKVANYHSGFADINDSGAELVDGVLNWESTAAIDQIDVSFTFADFDAGSAFYLYGIL
jgi:hypothetical protein